MDDLEFEDRRFQGAAAAPNIPPVFAPLLARALAVCDSAERQVLLEHHTRTLQRLRAGVVACSDEPQRMLLHTPLDLAVMPRLAAALDGFFSLLAEVGVPSEVALGARNAHALVAARPTLAALFAGAYYGGYGPPLYLGPNDLAALGRELAAGDPVLAVIDRRLPGPLVHELSHFGRSRHALASPYLDECVAAYIGTLAYPALALPGPGDDAAMYMAAWFTQVGAHLSRLTGRDALIRAHAGVIPWSDVLPAGLLPVLERLAWDQWLERRGPSFLGHTDQPDPWIKAFWLAAAGRLPDDVSLGELARWPWADLPRGAWTDADAALLAWGRAALATEPRLTPEGAWRVDARPCETTIDGSGRIVRSGPPYPREFTPLHVLAPPGATSAT